MFGAKSKSAASREWDKRRVKLVDPTDEETKVDEEQEEACAATIELLLAAGYFRARVSTLSRFDKVVGGLAWCISSANVELDVNLRFAENMAIGQKIKLGENIVKALQRMKCTYPLQSHQIQGEDFVKIYPVVQWLVKKVLEIREETGDLLRMYSESLFDKNYTLPSDVDAAMLRVASSAFSESLAERYHPVRRFRRAARESMTPEQRVSAALLEYGRQYKVSEATVEEAKREAEAGKVESDKFGKLAHLVEQRQMDRQEAVRNEVAKQEEEVKQMMSGMATVESVAGKVSRSAISFVIGRSSEEIKQMSAAYLEKSRSLGMTEEQMERKFVEESHRRVTITLQKQISVLETKVEEARRRVATVSQTVEESNSVLEKRSRYNQRVLRETETYAAMETPENAEDIAKLRALVALNESLKGQEAQFKGNCKRQLLQFNEMIKQRRDEIGSGLKEQLAEIDGVCEQEEARLEKIRAMYAVKSREVASVRRKINDIPSRTQLVQYEKRFVDVFEQVSLKLQETRKYFSMYNTLSDTSDILAREIELLNNIHDYFRSGSKKKQKETLATSLAQTLQEVELSVKKSQAKLEDEKKDRARVSAMHQSALEKSREYFKLVKQFQEECRRNEELSAQVGQ